MIGAFYSLGVDLWAKSEDLWEGIFALIASIIITVSFNSFESLTRIDQLTNILLS